MSGAFSSLKYKNVKHCSTHPKFLHSNSTSHRWAFGAIAELIDNAIDPDVNASQFCIDLKEFNNEPCLVLMDNGCGLNPERLHKMLSFGHSKKQMTPGDRSIGKHGNGFKSGTMRLGKDVLVLTKCAVSMTTGFLSQTFLAAVGAEDILIPLVTWDLRGNRMSPKHADIEESLQAICTYSIFPDEASILAQLDAIPGTGTILIISNLRRHEGILEMDYKTDPHDIRITSEITSSHYQQLRPNQPNSTDVPSDYSLRAYVSILYKVPRMQIFIRDNKVKTKRVSGLLSQKVTETYKPMGVTDPVKIEMGFNTENRNLYGMMLYHRNRLIKPYMRVGMQLEENERGMGVLGIVEADFLHPTHNKQDFDDTTAYRRLLKKLSDVLAEYWWEKKERISLSLPQPETPTKRPAEPESVDEDVPDVVWVQCDNPSCLKWRVLPEGTDAATLPDSWFCEYHPIAKFRRHEEPEEEWDASVQHEIIERRKERKREYDRERKEKEAHKRRQRLEVIVGREEQMAIHRQREALRKEMEEQKAKDFEAIEQERKAREEEVLKLQKELHEMQARRDEIQKQHIELLHRLEVDGAKKSTAPVKKDENHVQFSEHEMSQVGVSGSEDISEERPVDSRKTDEACSGQQNDGRTQWKGNELPSDGTQQLPDQVNKDYPQGNHQHYEHRQETRLLTPSLDGEPYQHRPETSKDDKLVGNEDYQRQQASLFPLQKQFVVHDDRRNYQNQEEIHFSGGRTGEEERHNRQYQGADQQLTEERNNNDEGYGHPLDARFSSKRTNELGQAFQWRQHPYGSDRQYGEDRHPQDHHMGVNRIQGSELIEPTSNRFQDNRHSQLKGNELSISYAPIQPLQECMPGFSPQYPHAKQPPSAPQDQVTANGHTLGPLSSFQHVNMEGGRMYQDDSRGLLPRGTQRYQSVHGVVDAESLSLCSDAMIVPRADTSMSSGALQRREADSSLILSLQGRLRTALKTLLKLSGPLETQVDADEMLSSDLEVVTICEKATNYVGMRWQAYEQEIAKLKTELAYTVQAGQNFRIRAIAGEQWDNGNATILK
ncbi:MORC family CW-type zinc finger protein 4 [Selaginella moellendorffii]|nr:MORC family CW-type zinc finger protein 4 [Selaginella moellendorffii]|eukprot:XP_024514720.1 MORC family CW-type zinc finger protein 4 [Selaginella moellendorffii]